MVGYRRADPFVLIPRFEAVSLRLFEDDIWIFHLR